MGSAIAETLSHKGATLLLTWNHSKDAAMETVSRLQDGGGRAFAFHGDLTRDPAIHRMASEIKRRFGGLDVLVNLASIYERSPATRKDTVRSLDAHWAANTRSAYALSLAMAPLMRRRGGGRIIHISDWTSASGRPRYKDYSPYYVSKVAVKGAVEALALELAPRILVNAIAPGPILPPRGLSKNEEMAVRRSTPLERWGGAEEIAKAVVFLVETDFMTGETLRMDGGRHLY